LNKKSSDQRQLYFANVYSLVSGSACSRKGVVAFVFVKADITSGAEDNPENQNFAGKMLTKTGHRVAVANNGEEAFLK